MLHDLTSPAQLESAYQQITSLFREYAEWLFVSDGLIQSLRREEIEIHSRSAKDSCSPVGLKRALACGGCSVGIGTDNCSN
jgi:hypothetical protein